MIEINQLIDSIPVLPLPVRNDLFNSSNITLEKPIKVTGKIRSQAVMNEIINDLYYEHDYHDNRDDKEYKSSTKVKPKKLTIGVDEVGRGPLYGSVVVSAVILPNSLSGNIEELSLSSTCLSTLTDSKKLTEVKRERLFPVLKQESLGYVIVDIPAVVIDELNILQATLTGMRIACESLMIQIQQVAGNGYLKKYSLKDGNTDGLSYQLLIDGNKVPYFDCNKLSKHGLSLGNNILAEAWVKGDSRHTAIAAASVLAKVTRDRQIVQDGLIHKGYDLEKHKGYPTKTHLEAISRLGVLPEHRRSFKPVKQALGLI